MKEAKALLEKYKAGTCSAEEMRLIDKWLLEIHMGERSDLNPADFEQISNEVWEAVIASRKKEINKVTKLWPRIAVAAAAVAAITLGVWFYNISNTPRHPDIVSGSPLANDIAPGKNGATITLANGKMIQLSDTKTGVVVGEDLKYDDGTALSGLQPSLPGGEMKSMMLTANTAKGQTYQFTLPDGTKVWLNADSKLDFPSNFRNAKQRIVRISGEGYFEVSKDKAHPFLVESRGQTVEVLGTHFNINSYADEGNIRTTLLEGSVRINDVILKPNQQAILSPDHTIKVESVDANEASAWTGGKFVFSTEPLNSIMRKVARWYDVEVVYEDNIDSLEFSGTVSKFENVSKLLEMMERTGEFHFKIEGKKIIVAKGK